MKNSICFYFMIALSICSLCAQIPPHFEVMGDALIEGDARIDGEAHIYGKLGIGTASPAALIYVQQAASSWQNGISLVSPGGDRWTTYIDGASQYNFSKNAFIKAWIDDEGQYHESSDRRLKTGITKIDSILERVSRLRPVRFQYHAEDKSPDGDSHLGLIAQEVQILFPELVSQRGDGLLGLDYSKLGVLAIKALQELTVSLSGQQEVIDQQKIRIRELEDNSQYQQKQLTELLSMVEQLLADGG